MKLSNGRLQQQINFIIEIDKLKQVLRQTSLINQSRKENDAEHSWHLAIMAILLSEYAAEDIDLLQVLRMVLIHDLVEIDAGDTFCYDQAALADQAQREQRAANRIFGLLPADQAAELRAVWEEFEARKSPEARFAAALDRLQPLLHNYYTQGGTWRQFGVTLGQVMVRTRAIAAGSSILGEFANSLIQDALAQGFLGNSIDVPSESHS